MEIDSEHFVQSNINSISDNIVSDDSNEKPKATDNKSEAVIYSLNPLLNESLNNLVKRFERTKIPKPPPSKGHSIRKKSRIHTSLPNIFLPSTFDDKYCNTEKKVQWTNKLNLDLEKMKNFFRDNYSYWCKQKQRSQSIPILVRNNDEPDLQDFSSQNVDFICSRSKDDNNMTIKFTKCDPKTVDDNDEPEEMPQIKMSSIVPSEIDKMDVSCNESNSPKLNAVTTESDEKLPYSTHLYLDGAIIEPISPASPPQSELHNLSPYEHVQEDAESEPKHLKNDNYPELPIATQSQPVKNKRGRKPRKKKSQPVASKKIKSSAISSTEVNPDELESMSAPNLEPEMNDPPEITIINLTPDVDIVSFVDTSKMEQMENEVKVVLEQTNDLEILSKSITNSSVDTSMLPPRKRYKRLMYLENNKQSSPNDLASIDVPLQAVVKETGELEPNVLKNDTLTTEDEKITLKPVAPRSRSKRKKKTISSSTKSNIDKKTVVPLKSSTEEIVTNPEPMEMEIPILLKEVALNDNTEDIIEPVLKPEENMDAIDNVEEEMDTVDKQVERVKSVKKPTKNIAKPESLKRSKREAAARGFANMVAMSLNNNNSSQSQENSLESKQNPTTKKSNTSRPDSNDTSSETSTGKLFKRPRKSKNAEVGPPKSKIKLAKSPQVSNELDESLKKSKQIELEMTVTEKPSKVSKKTKEKAIQDENPPSPGETIVSTDSGNHDHVKFRKIRTNTYIDPKPIYWFEEVEKCGCKPSKLRSLFDKPEAVKPTGKGKLAKKGLGIVWDCGDNCLNRLTFTECQAKNCQCGDACSNQKIRKCEWAPGLKVKDFPGKGKGVLSTKPIREGTFIIEYVGEVINEHTFQDRMMNLYRDDSHHYCLHLDGDILIDAYRSGSAARFVNHSCQPNCEMQKWMVNGAYRMCLFAIENIPADTELYYDYNFCSFNTKNTQICLCGSASCRGFIGSKPRAEQTESQKDRKKLLYIFGRILSGREKLFIVRNSIFLLRNREFGRCQRLGIRKPQMSHGNRLPSTITEIKRRKAKKNQFLTQMSALNSIRSIKTRQLQNAQENEHLTRAAQLGQVLKDLYNTLLEQKDPLNPTHQLVAPFVNCLNRKKYPEFYRMIGSDSVASLSQVYTRLLDGGYTTMMAFDQDILQMLQNVEFYAGKQSNIGQCAERIKPIYKELKMNSIALYEALTDETFDDKEKQKLISNNLQQITSALAAMKSHTQQAEMDLPESSPANKNKKRKQILTGSNANARGRLERGSEVIKCICGFLIEAGHVMVQCDRCFVWQHAYCMNVARSSELADVTRMEPYYCHVCLNIPTESLIREIPRHFVISDETIGSDNTLFWTLLKSDNLFKIDDFVYIASDCDQKASNSKPKQSKSPSGSPSMMPVDLSHRTIMRIYSLWKDCNGQRWMEGGLFLRPYDSQLKSLVEQETTKVVGTNKRKASLSPIDLNTHKWHQYEVVYTNFTKILPLDCCLGRCFVLNSFTFKHGRPLLQNNLNNSNLDVFVCDWMINQNSEWSELDPGYLKINTKPYCFERFQENSSNDSVPVNNERFCRQYLADELLSIDEGFLPSVESHNPKINRRLSNDERISMKMHSLKKLLNKLVEFAHERNQKLPLSSTTSSVSGSASSSRGASPLCENAGAKSPLRPLMELMSHGPRKSSTPRKLITSDTVHESAEDNNIKPISNESMVYVKEVTTIASDTSDGSPQLMIVVDEFQQTPKTEANAGGIEDLSKTVEKSSSTDDKDIEEKTVSSAKEIVDDQSNLGSEINFGDFVNLLKNTDTINLPSVKEKPSRTKPKTSKVKSKPNKKSTKKTKKKVVLKKGELKPVSEITAAEDEWVPVANVEVASNRPRTRSRKTATAIDPSNEEIEKCTESSSSNNNTEVELILTGLNIKGIFTDNDNPTSGNAETTKPPLSPKPSESAKVDEEEDDSTKSCFVKLERMKMKQKRERENSQSAISVKNKENSKNQSSMTKVEDVSKTKAGEFQSTSSATTNPDSSSSTKSSATTTVTSKSNSKSKSQTNTSSSTSKSDISKHDNPNTQSNTQQTSANNDDNDNDKQEGTNPNVSSISNRSKRKKGVPKRIPFDFSYPQIAPIAPVVTPVVGSRFEDEIVDLSSCRSNLPDQPDQLASNTQKPESSESDIPVVPIVTNKKSDPTIPPEVPFTTNIITVTEGRHIPAANDFSSIENISSN